MDWTRCRRRFARRAACGSGALFLHGWLAWALPSPPEPASPTGGTTSFSLWFEAVPSQQSGPGERDSPDEQVAAPEKRAGASSRERGLGRHRAARGVQDVTAMPSAEMQTSTSEARVSQPDGTQPGVAMMATTESAEGTALAAAPVASGTPLEGASGSFSAGVAAFGAQAAVGGLGVGRVAGSPRAEGGGQGAVQGRAHGPALLALPHPCARYFPPSARANHGEVQVSVEVDAQGQTSASAVLVEAPLGQGFGPAARACIRELHFAPAVSGTGSAVPGHAKLKLSFDRRSAT